MFLQVYGEKKKSKQQIEISRRTILVGKALGRNLLTVITAVLALLAIMPLVLTLVNSFMSEQEINYYYTNADGMEAGNSGNSASYRGIRLIPDVVTINQYYSVLILKTQYHFLFWNSIRVVAPIVAGQIAVASMAAFAFSKIRFKWRDKLFFVYIIVMMMPFQVTLVPNYIVADRIGLMNNTLSIILPGIFSAFGVFLLRQSMISIPDVYCEAAFVDGANPFEIFIRVILPMSKAGIASMAILVFIDNWNMVEQPLIFLHDDTKQLLSVFLSTINENERGIAFAASSIYMAPMLLAFLYGENYLVGGIQLSGVKA